MGVALTGALLVSGVAPSWFATPVEASVAPVGEVVSDADLAAVDDPAERAGLRLQLHEAEVAAVRAEQESRRASLDTWLQTLPLLLLIVGAVTAVRQLRHTIEAGQQAHILATDRMSVEIDSARQDRALAREGQRADRFTAAVDQLGAEGDNRVHVRVGALLALAQIARDDEAWLVPVAAQVCAFLRATRARPLQGDRTIVRPELADLERAPLRGRAPDTQTALEVLSELRRRGGPAVRLDLVALDLTSADLRGLVLDGADLSWSLLACAEAEGVQLRGATLFRADLRWADLDEADLSGVKASGVVLEHARAPGLIARNAELNEAEAMEAYLRGADLSCAELRGADMRLCGLSDVKLLGADLAHAKFQDDDGLEARKKAVVDGADFTGANLRKAEWSVSWFAQAEAITDGANVFADDWSRPAECAASTPGADPERVVLDGDRAPGSGLSRRGVRR